jgi:quercetin dioxygenase-like cupin family protein
MSLELLTDEHLASSGIAVAHHFGGGAYAKETVIPAGAVLTQHVHPHDHLSILASGRARVVAGGHAETHEGPACLTIKAGVHHSVEALTPVVWFCVHATEDTDPATVDISILSGA